MIKYLAIILMTMVIPLM